MPPAALSRSRHSCASAARRSTPASAARRGNPLFQDIIVGQDDSKASLSVLRGTQTSMIAARRRRKANPGADIARHDVKVDVKAVPAGTRSVARTLVEEARCFTADMIVLGGYGHSRTREWILGGVTRDILALAKTPLLFSR